MTGVYFARARLCDADLGRMLSRDPVKRGLNGYPYCGSDPVNHTDPTGKFPPCCFLAQAEESWGGICVLQDIFGDGLEVRKAYGYHYEIRDPDQPERDGFDLGDFVRSTLIGGLMGGLSGVAFYGMGKAVKALEGSLSEGSKGGIGNIKTDESGNYPRKINS